MHLTCTRNGKESVAPLGGEMRLPPGVRASDQLAVSLRVVKVIDHPAMVMGTDAGASDAAPSTTRRVYLGAAGWRDLPVFRIEAQRPGARGEGPAIVEESFFTCRVPQGWRFEFNASRDIVLRRR